jgi:alcohol dehydrogenase
VGPPTVSFVKEVGLGLPIQAVAFFSSLVTNIKFSLRNLHYIFLFMLPDGKNLEEIATLVEQGSIRPIVDKVFPFEQANEALAYVEKGHSRGKVIVSLSK